MQDVKVNDFTKPTNDLKPYGPPKSNYSINAYAKPTKAEIEAIKLKYVDERRECNGREDYFDWLKRVDDDERLSNEDKKLIKATN